MFCGVFVEDKRLHSSLHIWRLLRDNSGYISEKKIGLYSVFEIRLLVYQDNWFVSVSNYHKRVV